MKIILQNDGGFTLIELLVVIGIISILALIAVPNFLEAQTRSKVSRVKSDERTMAIAIEAYATDHQDYPGVDYPTWSIPHGLSQEYPTAGMTTPIAYLTSIPNDPFGGTLNMNDLQFSNVEYWYATQKAYADTTSHGAYPWMVSHDAGGADDPSQYTTQWNLQSRGPDRTFKRADGDQDARETDQPMKWQYDPTNGTVSEGNIVRVGP